jgi:hypothetical protein
MDVQQVCAGRPENLYANSSSNPTPKVEIRNKTNKFLNFFSRLLNIPVGGDSFDLQAHRQDAGSAQIGIVYIQFAAYSGGFKA